MKINNVKDFVKAIDEKIPEATPETVRAQLNVIGGDTINTGKCAAATLMCLSSTAINAYRTLEDSAMLGLMISKTTTKKAINKVKNFYTNTPAMAVCR